MTENQCFVLPAWGAVAETPPFCSPTQTHIWSNYWNFVSPFPHRAWFLVLSLCTPMYSGIWPVSWNSMSIGTPDLTPPKQGGSSATPSFPRPHMTIYVVLAVSSRLAPPAQAWFLKLLHFAATVCLYMELCGTDALPLSLTDSLTHSRRHAHFPSTLKATL